MTIQKEQFLALSEGLEGGKELANSIFNDLQEGFNSINYNSINVTLFKDELIDLIDEKQDMRWMGPLIFVRNVEKKHILQAN